MEPLNQGSWGSAMERKAQARSRKLPGPPSQQTSRSGESRGGGSRPAGATLSWPGGSPQAAPASTTESRTCRACAASWSHRIREEKRACQPAKQPAPAGIAAALHSSITQQCPEPCARSSSRAGGCAKLGGTGILHRERVPPAMRCSRSAFCACRNGARRLIFPVLFPALAPVVHWNGFLFCPPSAVVRRARCAGAPEDDE